MPDASSRWSARLPRPMRAARWARWAADIAARRRRLAGRWSRPGIVLARPTGAPVVQTSYHATWTFAPRVQLVLGILAAPGAAGPLARQARALDDEPRRPSSTRRAAVARPVDREPPRVRHLPVVAVAGRAAPRRPGAGGSGGAGIAVPAASGPVPHADPPAVERVMALGQVLPRGPGPRRRSTRVVPVQSPALVLDDGRRVLHRARDERRRVEQRTAQPMSIHGSAHHARPADPFTPGPWPGHGTQAAPWSVAPATAPVEAIIDIPGLTDQVVQTINRRIVAQRERQGRAF